MAKRCADDSRLQGTSPKKSCRSIYSVDMMAKSMAPIGDVSLPSLHALLGGRCRKRPYSFENEETTEDAVPSLRRALCHSREHAVNVLTVPTCGVLQERRRSLTVEKRPRQESFGSDTATPTMNDKPKGDSHSEDCTYNSFQFWRVPLPELDLSLLQDDSDHSQTKERSKVSGSSADAMET
ncbi:unnamed protein product [Menidia menidia]|uniref:(Atlantic silverside) hypothetical protein n=1 Tax=Menidia menidia TaxID=238744 RepID=A0A8S4B680_9TELE|nr:unnamed protein product [Menidia menidia]